MSWLFPTIFSCLASKKIVLEIRLLSFSNRNKSLTYFIIFFILLSSPSSLFAARTFQLKSNANLLKFKQYFQIPKIYIFLFFRLCQWNFFILMKKELLMMKWKLTWSHKATNTIALSLLKKIMLMIIYLFITQFDCKMKYTQSGYSINYQFWTNSINQVIFSIRIKRSHIFHVRPWKISNNWSLSHTLQTHSL